MKYFNEWLDGVGARSAVRRLNAIQCGKIFSGQPRRQGTKAVTSVTPRDVEGFLKSRFKSGVAPKTAIVDLKIIKIAFRRAETYGNILKNPMSAVRPPKEVSSEREVFTQEEVQKMLIVRPHRSIGRH